MNRQHCARPGGLAVHLRFAIGSLLVGVLSSACASAPGHTEARFYPELPEQPRIQYLTTISSQEDVRPTSAFRRYVVGTPQQPGLQRPWAIGHDRGRIYVVDKGLNHVVIIDLDERRFDRLVTGGQAALVEPSGIFIANDGFKYISDAGRGQVLEFDTENRYTRAFGSQEQFRPLDVVVRGGKLYVCDVRDEEIEILDRESGEVVGRIGHQGDGPGAFRFPTHLALGSDGDLFVTDLMNFRVQRFDAEGNYVRDIGEWGDFPGAMPRPKGIAVDRKGNLYAADAAFEMIQVFDTETARPLLPFGKFGTGPGGSYLPSGVHIDYENMDRFSRYLAPGFTPEYLIYVANQAGPDKLNVYALGHWEDPNPGQSPEPVPVPAPQPVPGQGEDAPDH